MYEISFDALTTSEDWAEAIQVISDTTDLPDETVSAERVQIQVRDHCDCLMLSLDSNTGTITFPNTSTFAWRVTPAQRASWCPGKTYSVGILFTNDTGKEQFARGTLPYIDGYVK